MDVTYEILNSHDDNYKYYIDTIKNVSWAAGASLANKIKHNEFNDWEHVFIGLDKQKQIVCFCTVTKTDSIVNESLYPFIGYLFVSEKYRGNRISEKLLKSAENYLKALNFKKVYLVSGEQGLYEKFNYKKRQKVKTIYNTTEYLYYKNIN